MVIYVCHPLAGNVAQNVMLIRDIARRLVTQGHSPIAPQLYLPSILDEASERDLAMRVCTELVCCCDELWVYGTRITPGMYVELDVARAHQIPIVSKSRQLALRGHLPQTQHQQ